MKQIVSPRPDVSRKEILNVEDATVTIKAIIVSDITKGVPKADTEAKISSVIRECLKKSISASCPGFGNRSKRWRRAITICFRKICGSPIRT